MEIKVQLRNLRMAPRKVRLVVDVVRGLPVAKAETQLYYMSRQAAVPVLKLMRSAVANAEHNYKLDPSTLFIKRIEVNDGLTLKRWQPKAMGRATPIRQRASHVTLILDTKPQVKKIQAKS